MEQFNQQHPGGQQAFPQTNQQEKQLIAILGVQGLSYQNYSVLELKIVLQIIKHAQKAILGYVIPYQVTSQTFNGFTAEQRAADHTDVIMKLSEFPYGAHHYPQLRDPSPSCCRLSWKNRHYTGNLHACLRVRYTKTGTRTGW